MTETVKISDQDITVHCYNTVIVGAGASGLNCAKKLYEYMDQKGISHPQERIAIITAGISLGASRMSGSDKQTYYKLGTSPDIPDSTHSFAESLTAAGCCHGDLALAEGIGSLRGFYNLVETGVPFPNDQMGTYIGYKTDHDPYERATSAGPKTSKFMCECLEKIVKKYGINIFDHQEAVQLLIKETGNDKRIIGVLTINKKSLTDKSYGINIFYCNNLVLAAGGPGALYETSVYPLGQTGIHGIAFKAGLAAENLTESQFGLASTKFRWNVSGTYMQAIPRIYSTDSNGENERDFLSDFFPNISSLATNIFLKGYQWPFDPQRIDNCQSSLIDILVYNETKKGRHVFMDFLHNPVGKGSEEFKLKELQEEALSYLKAAGALQQLPIERLESMNAPAIEIYKEHNIDLYSEPLEIAVCAQHNNGGFAVNKWWESNIKHTFIIGEMAGTHGVKRPGGSALNAGQVGAQRAAEYITNAYNNDTIQMPSDENDLEIQINVVIDSLNDYRKSDTDLTPQKAISQIQHRMTTSAGHIRKLRDAENALSQAVKLYNNIKDNGFKLTGIKDIIIAIQAEHLALASVAYLKAIVELLKSGGGSRGSHLVLTEDGIEIHHDIKDPDTEKSLKYKPENKELRKTVLQIKFDETCVDLFSTQPVQVRQIPTDRKAFEPAWAEFREGKIYQ